MAGRAVLRLFTFVPAGTPRVLDARLRDEIAPRIAEQPGLTALFLARRAGDDGEQRAVATAWTDPDAMDAALEPGRLAAIEGELHGDAEVLAPRVELLDRGVADSTVLRVFRGTVREGALDRYVELAREGTLSDMAAGIGPIALYLAPVPPDAVVTVSVWADWGRVMQATGGKLDKPIATRHADQLVRASVAHFEVIPTRVAGLVGPRSAVD